MSKKSVAKLVAKQIDKAMGKETATKEETDLHDYLTSMVAAAIDGTKTKGTTTTASATGIAAEPPQAKATLRSILKSARNSGKK